MCVCVRVCVCVYMYLCTMCSHDMYMYIYIHIHPDKTSRFDLFTFHVFMSTRNSKPPRTVDARGKPMLHRQPT